MRHRGLFIFLAIFVLFLWIGLEVLRRQYEKLREPLRRHRAAPGQVVVPPGHPES